MTYTEYRNLMENLVDQKQSTGENQSEAFVNYTLLNHQRMKRLDKKGAIADTYVETIKAHQTPMKWTVLTESWCGDAAQVLPYINKVASLNNHIELDIILRDENLELMDQHLTNGGRAIPKLIASDENGNTISSFGPRPSIATKMISDYKAKYGTVSDEIKKDLQVWYTKNKGQNIIADLVESVF